MGSNQGFRLGKFMGVGKTIKDTQSENDTSMDTTVVAKDRIAPDIVGTRRWD
jgi:hypothetical protein